MGGYVFYALCHALNAGRRERQAVEHSFAHAVFFCGFKVFFVRGKNFCLTRAQSVLPTMPPRPGVDRHLNRVIGMTRNADPAVLAERNPAAFMDEVQTHLGALHEVGSNNPDGIDIKKHKDENGWPLDAVAFHPYFTVKDMIGVAGFLFFFCAIIFFKPDMWGYFLEKPNFEVANGLKTPAHIAPVWYFTPFYAILRAVPDKLLGVIMMGLSIVVLFLLPWLDRCKVRSVRYRSTLHKLNIAQFVVCFIILGVLGVLPSTPTLTLIAQLCTLGYFGFFVLLFFYSKNENTKPLPERVTFK